MKQLALATSVLLVSVGLLVWVRGTDRSNNSVDRQRLIVDKPSVTTVGFPPQTLRPVTRPSMPGLYRRIPEVDLRNVPLEDAIERLRTASGLNIVVQWNALERLGLDRETPITLKLRDVSVLAVARAMLQSRIITLGRPICLIDENVVILTAGMDSTGFAETHVYDVGDIILDAIAFRSRLPTTVPSAAVSAPGFGSGLWSPVGNGNDEYTVAYTLGERIKQIGRESWIENGGKTGLLSYFAGHFVVTATPEMHDEIGLLLAELRKRK